MEFHVSRNARDRYQFAETLFAFNGNVIFANFRAARMFAQSMNRKRDLVNFPEQAVKAGQLAAMGLIDEILHVVFQVYRERVNPNILQEALAWLYDSLGEAEVETALRTFADEFPPVAVYRRDTDLDTYFVGQTAGVSHRQVELEEKLMLWLANANPAFAPFLELFDDTTLEKRTVYPQIIPRLYAFFATQPGFGASGENIIDVLRAPALASPHSLDGQLRYIQERWGSLLGSYLYRLLRSLDLIAEEEKLIFLGPGTVEVPVFD